MNRPEERVQRELVAYLRANLPKPWLVFHVPNGGGRSKAEAGILKAMGVLAGVPDLLVIGPLPEGTVSFWSDTVAASSIVAIELKAPPKRLRSGLLSNAKPRLNPSQRSLQADLGACGVPVLVCDSVVGAVTALQGLGVPLRGRVQ